MEIPDNLPDAIADLYIQVADLQRRAANANRIGLVTDVDEAKGMVRAEIGRDQRTGAVMKSPWMPVEELAMGGIRTSFLPRVGEQISMSSESGDFTDARAGFSVPTDKNNRPPGKAGEGWITADGDVAITVKAGEIKLAVGGVYILITAAGLEFVGEAKSKGNWTQDGIHKDTKGTHS